MTTLYEIMGENMLIWAKKLPSGEINVRVTNENEEEVFNESSHRGAWDTLVYFAKQILDENAQIEAIETSQDEWK